MLIQSENASFCSKIANVYTNPDVRPANGFLIFLGGGSGREALFTTFWVLCISISVCRSNVLYGKSKRVHGGTRRAQHGMTSCCCPINKSVMMQQAAVDTAPLPADERNVSRCLHRPDIYDKANMRGTTCSTQKIIETWNQGCFI